MVFKLSKECLWNQIVLLTVRDNLMPTSWDSQSLCVNGVYRGLFGVSNYKLLPLKLLY